MALVLIITNQQDIHADLVLRELLRRDVPVVRIHTDEFPMTVRITYQDDDAQIDILSSGRSFRTSQVTAVWYRRQKAPTIDPKIMDAATHDESLFCLLMFPLLESCNHLRSYLSPPYPLFCQK